MAVLGPVEYAAAAAEVRAVYDDIKRTRRVEDVNNFWKYLAHDPATLKRTWESIKEVMAPGALDARTKEMIYLAVSVTNGCGYCIASHGVAARKAGMTEAMFGDLMAVVGMANETNRLANGYRVPIDPAFEKQRAANPAKRKFQEKARQRPASPFGDRAIARQGAPRSASTGWSGVSAMKSAPNSSATCGVPALP